MRIVIQPHSDDAYLSMHQHIVGWVKAGETVVIITLWDRKGEGANYAEAVGALHERLYDHDHHPHLAPGGTWSCHRTKQVLPLIRGARNIGANPGDSIYSPVGLEHIEHIYCRDLMVCIKDQIAGGPDQYYWHTYMDTPYWGKRVNEGLTHDAFLDPLSTGVSSFRAPCGRKYMKKWLKLFPTQGMFFHFNLDKLKNTPEIILNADL